MKRIEMKANPDRGKGILILYAGAFIGLLNIHSYGIFGALCWMFIWSIFIFLLDSIMRYKRNRFRLIFDDNGIEASDWMNHCHFSWNDLIVEEVHVYTQSSGKSSSTPIGKSVIPHGGRPGTAVEQKSGAQSGSPLVSGSYTMLVFRANNEEFRIRQEILSDGDYIDLLGILNLRVCSKSESSIKIGSLRTAKKFLEKKTYLSIIQAGNQVAADQSTLAQLKKALELAEKDSSPLGFSKLPFLESYANALEQHGEAEKAASIRSEMD